jgi:hypothetical protein
MEGIFMAAKPTRRRFLQAAAASVPLVAVPAAAAAQAGEQPATADEALLALVRLRFGKNLNEEQTRAVHRSLQGGLAMAEVLRRVRLDPTDEPATVFVADVAE